jgi:hypothetical protein
VALSGFLSSEVRVAFVVAWASCLGALLAPSDTRGDAPLAWESGDHKVSLSLSSRFRVEVWDARATDTDIFTAFRSRVGLKYSYKKSFVTFAEFQDARINGLDSDTSGAGALYRAAAGGKSRTSGDRIRQLWIQFKPTSALTLRAGRQDIKLGTEVMYPEGNWKYLKIARLSQRVVGTVGWTHAERSNDGVTAAYDFGDHHLYLFGAKPTTGVFDLNSSYASQEEIIYGGASWTAKRGTWLPNTEVRLFGLYYEDERDASEGAFGGLDNQTLRVWTAGFSSVGIYPCGEGNADLTLWAAYQWGDWPALGPNLDHQAWAALVEGGYQWTNVRMKPWVRAGVNIASGDGSTTDGDHESFFNVLPTNHLYYGYADQFALGNLINYFAQLRLKPFAKTGLDLFLHHFTKLTSDDGRHFGTGAFNKNGFGYGLDTTTTHRGMGTAVDIVVSHKLHERVSLLAGYSYMWGHAHWNSLPDADTRFAFFQVTAKY